MKSNILSYSRALASAAVILILIINSSNASAFTLNVGSTAKYKTIQSAVNAAHSGDTIKVSAGQYKEYINITNNRLSILGTNHPKVDGFFFYGGSGTINGFSIQKYGIDAWYAGGSESIIKNNYFYNCGVYLAGGVASGSIIMNNQITNGTIYLCDTLNQTITGNTISKSKIGLKFEDLAEVSLVNKNTFKNCDIAVLTYKQSLNKFIGNKYIGNKINVKIISY